MTISDPFNIQKIAHDLYQKNEDFALLYSSEKRDYSGDNSYLCYEVKQLAANLQEMEDGDKWVGYFGYPSKNGAGGKLESLLPFPDFYFAKYKHIIPFSGKLELDFSAPELNFLISNMSRSEYLAKIMIIQEKIRVGELYQANLTRKFFGEFNRQPDYFALFLTLCKISPSPYSAFIKFGDHCIISSSPEQFLRIDENDRIESRPIKGSAAISTNSIDLYNSAKNRAENMMIVDLVRNDIGRCAKIGSVKVEKLFEVTSYSTIHHMSSLITGIKKEDCSNLEVVKACFPPGSMTGAPKIKAMDICMELEQMERGVYSGAIGIFSNNYVDLSVIIRTIIAKKNQFEFQLGGGITHDSIAEEEWAETITKALAIIKALNISKNKIEAL